MNVLEEYFKDNIQVAIHNVSVTLQDIQTFSFKEMLAHDRTPTGSSVAMSIFEKISSLLNPLQGKTILDVGCHIGHFSFLMAESGAIVTGVESNPLLALIAEYIKSLKKLQVRIVSMAIEDFLRVDNAFYDAVLLLNVFDQMLREDEESAWKTLRQIRQNSKFMFMMTGSTEQLPNAPGLRTSLPLSVQVNPTKESWEYGYEMIMRKAEYKNFNVLLRNSYAERELWLFY